MTEKSPGQENAETKAPSPLISDAYYTLLLKIIDEAAKDTSLLRNLVYAFARQTITPEISHRTPETFGQGREMSNLERGLNIAIQRVESDVARRTGQPSMWLERVPAPRV